MSSMGRTRLEDEEIFCPLSLCQGSVAQHRPLTHTQTDTHTFWRDLRSCSKLLGEVKYCHLHCGGFHTRALG